VQSGVADAFGDAALIAVHLRGVDVPVSGVQCGTHRGGGLVRRDLVDPETDLRDLGAVVERDGWNGGHVHSWSVLAAANVHSMRKIRAGSAVVTRSPLRPYPFLAWIDLVRRSPHRAQH